MRQGTVEERFAAFEQTIEARLLAFELMILALAQRAPEGKFATAAALIMLGDLEREMRGERMAAPVLAGARTALEKIAAEVLAFSAGDGVEMR